MTSVKTVSISLAEEEAGRLDEAARQVGVSPEEFLRQAMEEKLELATGEFADAAREVLDKNRELYRRLS
jgi:antitoxin FitA